MARWSERSVIAPKGEGGTSCARMTASRQRREKADEIVNAPPRPGGDLRTMLRRHIVARALRQLAEAGARRARCHSPADWKRHAAAVRRQFARAMAHPQLTLPATWRARARGGSERAGLAIENLLVESLRGAWMNVTVWKPDPRVWPAPWRAIITPIGHNGKYSSNEQHPPQVFAANGFLAVSFDPPGFGEKARGNNHFEDGVRLYLTGQNPLAFFLGDARRAVDYALSRSDVDGRDGVAMTGVSGGGVTTIGCALLDERVRVAAPSCFGWDDREHPVLNGYAACPETLFFNRLGAGLGMVDLLGAIADKPLLLMSGARDEIMPDAPFRALVRDVRRAYRGAGVPERLGVFSDECGHAYSVPQAVQCVRWLRRWWGGPAGSTVAVVPTVTLLPAADLQSRPPEGFSMRAAAASAAKRRVRPRSPSEARRALAKLIPGLAESRRRGFKAEVSQAAGVWTHATSEVSLRDGAAWELPATALQPAQNGRPRVIVFFDDRGRWRALEQGRWLGRAAGVFAPPEQQLGLLTVDLAGWGDTTPTPTPFSLASWGGIDRWIGYVSAATGESAMALRVRDAVRCLDWVRREWGVRARDVVIGGYGVGATVAGLAALLHGGVGALLLVEPLASFAGLAVGRKSTRSHDVYFPGILGAVDLPEAVRFADVRTLVLGPRDGAGKRLGARARDEFTGRDVSVESRALDAASEVTLLAWLDEWRRQS